MPLKDDDIKQLIAILQKGLSSENNTEEEEAEEKDDTSKDKTEKEVVIKTRQSGSISNSKNKKLTTKTINKFDNMPEKDMFKSDSKIDKLLNVHPPTPRTRVYKPVKVTCRVCHKNEEISPHLLYDSPERYKCNKCSGAPG